MAGPVILGCDRVRESSVTTGTGDFTLDGAVTGGFFRFQDVLAVNDTTIYVIQNTAANEAEVGICTLTAVNVIQRTTVKRSTNSNSLVNFSAGTKIVFIDVDAAFLSIIGLTLEASPNASTDYIAVYDVSSGGIKKVLLNTIGVFGSGSNNERYGVGAGRDAATGSNNVVIGNAAGDALTTGSRNIGIGSNTLGTATSASDDIAIGNAAGDALTIGGENILIGTNAGGALTSASSNIVVGHNSLNTLTSSTTSNICIGNNVGSLISGGFGLNVLIGSSAGESITTGFANVVIGTASSVSTGNYNILVGNNANITAGATEDAIALGRDSVASANQFSLGPFINVQTFFGDSSITTRERADLTVSWIDATDATRMARIVLNVWDTAQREGFRVDTDGSGANFSFFAAGSFGSGRNVVFVPNAAVDPSTNPTGGGILYASGGAGKWRGSSGTTTTFGPAEPHCPRCGRDYALAWENDAKSWPRLSVCVPCLIQALDLRGISCDEFVF